MTQSKPDQMSEARALVKRLTGYTPGPWSVIYYDAGDQDHYDHNGPCPLIAAPEDQDCAIVHWDGFKQKFWSSANGNQKQIESNADLIAAAPEMHSALTAALDEIATLRTEKHADAEAIGALRVALHNCLNIIDGLIEESGRSIEYGEEDPFRMGEWFDQDDMHALSAAREALKGSDK